MTQTIEMFFNLGLFSWIKEFFFHNSSTTNSYHILVNISSTLFYDSISTIYEIDDENPNIITLFG